jgi:hypothetical protein
MKHSIIAFLAILLLNSCTYFKMQDDEEVTSEIVAIVNIQKLYKKDLLSILPEYISKEDSVILVKSFINNWAIKQILLQKAENNNSLEEINEIELLVKDYRESLLINNYKEILIKQQLDTLIKEEEIVDFYSKNKENFKLNEELVKIKYLHFDKKLINKNELIKLFASRKIEDLEKLEKQQLSFKQFQFNDSVWTQLDKILLKLPFSKDNMLKKSKLLEKQDSLGLYLVAIKEVLFRNDIAPLSYIRSTIKQMILHKRKIELIKDIEKILVKDATKNNNFKVY